MSHNSAKYIAALRTANVDPATIALIEAQVKAQSRQLSAETIQSAAKSTERQTLKPSPVAQPEPHRREQSQGTILSLDPSTTATGWAIGIKGVVVKAGVITPTKKHPWLTRLHMMSAELSRLMMANDIDFPDRVIIESPDGKIHRGNKASGGQGASKYGFAVGMFYGAFAAHDVPVDAISVNQWTRGKPKERRARSIEILCPHLDFGKDSGLDAHDAAAMLQWWYDLQQFEQANRFPTTGVKV